MRPAARDERASASSMPHSDAAEPEIRASPVTSFSWNSAPRAKDPGKRPA